MIDTNFNNWDCSFCGKPAYLKRTKGEYKKRGPKPKNLELEYLCNNCITLEEKGFDLKKYYKGKNDASNAEYAAGATSAESK